MITPTAKKMAGILFSLDWSGHVELPDSDMFWLAGELARVLSGKVGLCESCGECRELLVLTPLGQVCESCISAFGELAREQRRVFE